MPAGGELSTLEADTAGELGSRELRAAELDCAAGEVSVVEVDRAGAELCTPAVDRAA
jgi:hypothetical protein